MKIASIVLSSLTVLLVLSQLICGLWISANETVPSNLVFHRQLGIGAVVMTLVSIAVMLVYIVRS